MFCPRAEPSLQAQGPRLQFCRRQVFHRKLRDQGCSFTRDWIRTVASRCFPRPTLSLASEQTLKDLKRSQGHQCGGKEMDLANWAHRTTEIHHRVKYQFHHGFWPDQRSRNRNHSSTPTLYSNLYVILVNIYNPSMPFGKIGFVDWLIDWLIDWLVYLVFRFSYTSNMN